MEGVPIIGVLTPYNIKTEMGVKGERSLQTIVSKVVRAVAEHSFGRSLLEGVYLAGFEHGATMMERKLSMENSDVG